MTEMRESLTCVGFIRSEAPAGEYSMTAVAPVVETDRYQDARWAAPINDEWTISDPSTVRPVRHDEEQHVSRMPPMQISDGDVICIAGHKLVRWCDRHRVGPWGHVENNGESIMTTTPIRSFRGSANRIRSVARRCLLSSGAIDLEDLAVFEAMAPYDRENEKDWYAVRSWAYLQLGDDEAYDLITYDGMQTFHMDESEYDSMVESISDRHEAMQAG